MLLEDFESAIEEYGTDLNDWPDGLRVQAQGLLDKSAEARSLLEAEIALDAAMFASHAKPISAPAGLADRIVLKAMETLPTAEIVQLRPVTKPIKPIKPVRPSATARLNRWWQEQRETGMAWRYAAVLLVCFAGGVVTSQLLTSAPGEDANPYYVAGLYADLAY